MRQLFLISIIFCITLSQEAIDNTQYQKEIDEQVWKPFIESYEAFDHVRFNALHTDDVLRASAWSVRVGSEYKERVTSGYQRNKDRGDKRTIDLWFEFRKAQENVAYEVGYYRVKTQSEGKERISHAIFHVVLKRINGVWKVAQDWDSQSVGGKKITAEDYARKAVVEFE